MCPLSSKIARFSCFLFHPRPEGIESLKISTTNFHFTELLPQRQTATINSYLENHRVALFSEATGASTATDDDTTIPHLSASPPPIDLLANEVVMERDKPYHDPSRLSFNLDGDSSRIRAEVEEALQNLSARIDQVLNSNNMKPENNNVRSRCQSTRKEIHVRSML